MEDGCNNQEQINGFHLYTNDKHFLNLFFKRIKGNKTQFLKSNTRYTNNHILNIFFYKFKGIIEMFKVQMYFETKY